MEEKVAHVIMCNDRVDSVVIGTGSDALQVCKKCIDNLYERTSIVDREAYSDVYYWHIHTVPLFTEEQV